MMNLPLCKKIIFLIITLIMIDGIGQSLENKKMPGYKPIWFELNQKYEYGDKYSGALGTYTAKHHPLAIYADVVDKTFFVYGGTKSPKSKHLLCMIGEFDHSSGLVSKPIVVCDKMGVDDPHDNPSILIDDQGFIWVFVSGRGKVRMGFKYKSKKPYSIEGFEKITTEEMTYPQPKKMGSTFFNFFTKYTGERQLYFEKSKNGIHWSEDRLLAAIPEKKDQKSGHYQISAQYKEKKIGTFFNRHPNGIVDQRTDLYYLETNDMGETWKTADQKSISVPVTEKSSLSRVVDYLSLKNNIYLKDMVFDSKGRPICLYIRSKGHKPGPENQPYEWCITKWNDSQWTTHTITTSDHNYDMGSLLFFKKELYLVAPTAIGSQKWGVGGELQVWKSHDSGVHWVKEKNLTQNSQMNHSYVRKSENFKAPFVFFWACGDAHQFSKSELFFGNLKGEIWKLPYNMEKESELPQQIK